MMTLSREEDRVLLLSMMEKSTFSGAIIDQIARLKREIENAPIVPPVAASGGSGGA